MTWTQLFECFSNSDSKLEKVLVLSTGGDLSWLDPETASATGAAGLARAVQVATQLADSKSIIWRARLCQSGALLDTRMLDASNLNPLKRHISMMRSFPSSCSMT